MPLILGLNSIHPDASAVLMNENGVIAAIAEERINRKKHCAGFPGQAIAEVLRMGGATIADIDHVCFAKDPKANITAKLKYILRSPLTGLRLDGRQPRSRSAPAQRP